MRIAPIIIIIAVISAVCQGYSTADFNRDEVVDLLDFSEFAFQWLKESNGLPEVMLPTTCATYVIATSSSAPHVQSRADYICDGVDDQIEIQHAIDSMTPIGGVIYLAEGIYWISDTITVDKPVFFRGAGVNWHYLGGLTRIYPVDGLSGPIIDSVGDYYLGGIFDIGFDGYYMTEEVNCPAVLLRATGGDYHIERSGFYNMKFLNAVRAECHNVWIHDTCFENIKHSSQDCYAIMVSEGWRNRIVNCHFRDNKNCIWFDSAGAEDWILGCDFHNTDCTVLKLNANYGVVSDSTLWSYNEAGGGYPMIQVAGNVYNWTIHDCEIRPYTDTPVVQVASGKFLSQFIFHDNRIYNFTGSQNTMFSGTIINSQIAGNIGYCTANGGSALVADGYTIVHGLASQPTIITLTPSVPGRMAAATTVDSIAITVSLRNTGGEEITVPETVYWYATCE